MRISVFITAYNQRGCLARAIESVLRQTLPPLEIVIVDDASTDGTQEIIRGYQRQHPDLVRAIFHTDNLGVTRSRVDALEAVRGDYVTFVDGDDRFLPRKLELEAGALREAHGASIAFSNYRYVASDGAPLGAWARGGERPPEGWIFKETVARAFPRRNLFRMELVDYRAWRAIGFHDPAFQLYEDYEMRIRLTRKLKAVYVDAVNGEYTLHGNGLSSRPITEHLDALTRIWEASLPLLEELSPAERLAIKDEVQGWLRPLAVSGIRRSLRRFPPSLSQLVGATRFVLNDVLGKGLPG